MSEQPTLSPGNQAIKSMIESAEATSITWDQFYKQIQMLSSTAIDTMPPHHITMSKKSAISSGARVSIHGPIFNYDHYGTKHWT